MLPSSPILVAPGLAGGAVARNLGRECLLVWTITLHSDLGAMPCTADTVCIGWLLCLTCRAVPHPGSAVLRGLMALRRVRPVGATGGPFPNILCNVTRCRSCPLCSGGWPAESWTPTVPRYFYPLSLVPRERRIWSGAGQFRYRSPADHFRRPWLSKCRMEGGCINVGPVFLQIPVSVSGRGWQRIDMGVRILLYAK